MSHWAILQTALTVRIFAATALSMVWLSKTHLFSALSTITVAQLRLGWRYLELNQWKYLQIIQLSRMKVTLKLVNIAGTRASTPMVASSDAASSISFHSFGSSAAHEQYEVMQKSI